MNFSKNFFKNIAWSPSEYTEAAVIARESSEEMLSRLDWMTIKPKMILDIGCGTGESTVKLRERYPDAEIIAIDISQQMIQHTKQHTSLVTCICAEGEKLPLRDQTIDLIFANFFLPWQQDVKTILREWLRVLSPNGLLMLTALGLNTLQEWREVLCSKHTPEWVDMHDVGDALLQAGFADPVLDVNHYLVTYRDKMRLIHELQASGLWFPSDQEDIERANSLAPTPEGVWPITYEVIYAHTFAPIENDEYTPSEDGIVKIPLAHLRRGFKKETSI